MPAATHFAPINFKTRFPALDGIRALAVTLVFALHYGGGIHGGRLMSLLNQVRLRGWIGVDIFFVLSGFLITGILYDTRSDSHFFRRFFARRAVRIFPVFYLTATVLLILTPFLHLHWRWPHLSFLVYLGNIPAAFDPSLYGVLGSTAAHKVVLEHLWSLCVEEQFYLVWPLLVWSIRDRIRLLWLASGLSVAALLLRTAIVVSGVSLDGGWLMKQLPFRMDALLIGGVLALLLRGPHADRWQRRCVLLFAIAGAASAIVLIFSSSLESPWLLTVGLTVIAIASVGLIGSTLRSGSLGFRLFHFTPLRVLGRYSYGFYVFHLIFAPAWAAFAALLRQKTQGTLSGPAAGVIAFVLNFAVTFAVAKLSYDLFESRFLRYKTRFEYDSELAAHRHAFIAR
jgi:peptidoglycan/LPS O-acetylase OafA/YrhL